MRAWREENLTARNGVVSGWVVAVLALADITNLVPRFLNGAFIEFPVAQSVGFRLTKTAFIAGLLLFVVNLVGVS